MARSLAAGKVVTSVGWHFTPSPLAQARPARYLKRVILVQDQKRESCVNTTSAHPQTIPFDASVVIIYLACKSEFC